MLDVEYIEIFNKASADLVSHFPDGKMPDNDAARSIAVELLRSKRQEFEQLALNSRISASVTYALEAQISQALSEEQLKEIRSRDKQNVVGKLIAVKDKRDEAIKSLMAAGFSEQDARALGDMAKKGKL